MSLENFLEHYGYIALVVGTFLEGETILILAGIAVKLGYLKMPGVITAAFIGTFAGDQLFFFLGRLKGRNMLAQRPHWQAKAKKVNSWLEQYQNSVILGFRFLYGFRTITPFIIGMSRIASAKFIIYNTFGALAWSIAVASLGYLFGHAAELVLDNLKGYEVKVLGGIALVGAGVWVWRLFIQPRKQ
jgi:membrane protein DedA with SNARE-associated domain